MTRDELKQLAREVGAEITDFIDYHYDDEVVVFEKDQLERFAALVAAAERNSILKMSAENWYKTQADYDAAIRARGESK
jgi:hypothetical protein